nr:NUDIX hydrolase [Armatimonas sp.]
MTYQINHVAVGILRWNDQFVLVQQQYIKEKPPFWVLPGGIVEPGELITEALVRELAEETGAVVESIGSLAYCMQIDHPARREQTIAYCFEIDSWSGVLQSADPDNEILSVALVPLADALQLLESIPWLAVREPLLAYLRGECPTGTLWFYRELDGVQVLLDRLTGELPT